MIYADAQFHRLGPNYLQIPINKPEVTVKTNYFAGEHQSEVEKKWPLYYPSTFGGLTPNPDYTETNYRLQCSTSGYYKYPDADSENDYYTQPRNFVDRVLDTSSRMQLVQNIGKSLRCIQKHSNLVAKVIEHLRKVSPNLGDEVANSYVRLVICLDVLEISGAL